MLLLLPLFSTLKTVIILNITPKSIEKNKGLLKLTEALTVDRKVVEKSAYSKFKDFEDGIQNYCAEENDISILSSLSSW